MVFPTAPQTGKSFYSYSHKWSCILRNSVLLSTTEQKKKRTKATLVVIAIFALLLTISYRNSKINEKFTEVQSLKKELSSLQKENEQLNQARFDQENEIKSQNREEGVS